MDASTLTHAHVARYLGQHCPSRWPVCTAVIALMLGLTVNSFSPSPATRLLGRMMATAACTFEDDGARRQSQGSSGVSAYCRYGNIDNIAILPTVCNGKRTDQVAV